MIEIIPNWHPLLVHFTVGLLSTSSLFYIGSAFLSHTNSWKQQWLNMANWSLWSGCLFAIGTAFAGWLAYNSVAHDSASHAAMTLHRNWALPTAATFLLLGLWAIFIARKNRRPGFLFLTFSTIAAGLLMVTGWLGAEAVYRYGLGVKSLPVVAEGADGHNHSHGAESSAVESTDGHNHSHDVESRAVENTDGHNHSHGAENNESDKVDYENTTTEIEQAPKENIPQHNHENIKTPLETEQMLKQDGHQHEHTSKDTISKVKKTITPNMQSSTLESHPHTSNNLKRLAHPLNQDNISEKTSLSSPSDLHSSFPTETQNKEAVIEESHSHETAHEH